MAKVGFATGGTLGHVMPALSVASELVSRGIATNEIMFFGTKFGQDKIVLSNKEFNYYLFPTKGLSGKNVFQSSLRLLMIIYSAMKALKILKKTNCEVIVSFGGYACLPPSLAGLLLRKPLIVVALDALPGKVTRLLSRFATLNLTAVSSNKRGQWYIGKFVNPKYLNIAKLKKDQHNIRKARERLGLNPDLDTLLIMSGSLGAKKINELAQLIVNELGTEINIIHISGVKNKVEITIPDQANYLGLEFLEDLTDVYLASDLAITRAGAISLSELIASNIFCIVIPLPNAADNHQMKNAYEAADTGLVKIVIQSEADGSYIKNLISEIFSQRKHKNFETNPDLSQELNGALKLAELLEEFISYNGRR